MKVRSTSAQVSGGGGPLDLSQAENDHTHRQRARSSRSEGTTAEPDGACGHVVAGISTLLLDLTYRGRSEDPKTPEAPAVPAPERPRVAPSRSEEIVR